MKFSRTEKTLLGASALGLLLLLLYPYLDMVGRSPSVSAEAPFAVLTPEGADVRTKDASAYDWRDVRKSVGVEENSRVFTGGTSRARLKFNDGAEMNVQEQTLIVVSKGAQDARVIDVQQGMVYFNLPGDGQEVLVRIGNRVERIKGTGARIKLENKNGKLGMTLVSGRAQVGEGNSARMLTQSQASVDLTEEGPTVLPSIRPVTPEDGGIVWLQEREAPVRLAWTTGGDGEVVSVLKRTETGEEVGRYESSTGALEVNDLAPGDYSWDLRSDDGSVQSSTRFRVRLLAPPEIEAVRSEDGTIRIAWRDESLSENYEVRVNESVGEGKTVLSTSTTDLGAQTGILPRGTYSIRVMSFRSDRPEPVLTSSMVNHFHDNVTSPAATELHLTERAYNFEMIWPGSQKTTPGFEAVEHPLIRWQSDVPSPMYNVQFARDYAFDRLVHEAESREPFYQWTDAPAGKWFVRVRPRGGLGENAPWSETSQIRTIFASPVMTGAAKSEADAAITVSWDAHPRIDRFEVVSADNPAFQNPIQKLTERRYEEMPLERNGRFYARVRGVDRNGWPVSPWSDAAVYLPGTESPAPVLPSPTLADRQPEDGAGQDSQTMSARIEDPVWRAFRRVARVWTGFGLNYFRLGQTADSDLETATFSNFAGPTLMGEIIVSLKNLYTFILGYHDQPGRIEQSAFGLTASNSRWQTITLDVGIPWTEFDMGDTPVKLGWRAGLMRHRFPFLYVDDGIVNQVFNDLNSLAVGVETELPLNRQWMFDGFLRYQYPLAASSSVGAVQYRSQLSFDGSVGIARKLNEHWMMGLYWFGQSQAMTYNYSNGAESAAGTQNFFNSNIQLRLGYELLSPLGM